MTTSTLLIFDIDGTLVSTKAGRRAFNRALERFFGVADAAEGIPMAGRTDLIIYRDICTRFGLDPGTFGAFKLEFVAQLAEALVDDPGHVLPGVVELLEACEQEPGYMLGLGTGNVEEGARLKLAPHDLNRFFPVGGFGDEGETRDDVIAMAIRRAEAQAGAAFDRVVVIGDTPLDIACGKANRCLTVGVATGYHAREELHACGADLVVADFSDLGAVLLGLRGL
ncbi:MAG TPA: haloacid dehalogenase-like hydrolase [Symbiobacteriaceae bacterium]|nr:haloacid dehalogenase-like hydrolase [Symbiobacteriaceae bacterium]